MHIQTQAIIVHTQSKNIFKSFEKIFFQKYFLKIKKQNQKKQELSKYIYIHMSTKYHILTAPVYAILIKIT